MKKLTVLKFILVVFIAISYLFVDSWEKNHPQDQLNWYIYLPLFLLFICLFIVFILDYRSTHRSTESYIEHLQQKIIHSKALIKKGFISHFIICTLSFSFVYYLLMTFSQKGSSAFLTLEMGRILKSLGLGSLFSLFMWFLMNVQLKKDIKKMHELKQDQTKQD